MKKILFIVSVQFISIVSIFSNSKADVSKYLLFSIERPATKKILNPMTTKVATQIGIYSDGSVIKNITKYKHIRDLENNSIFEYIVTDTSLMPKLNKLSEINQCATKLQQAKSIESAGNIKVQYRVYHNKDKYVEFAILTDDGLLSAEGNCAASMVSLLSSLTVLSLKP